VGLFRNNDWWQRRVSDYRQDPTPYHLVLFLLGLSVVVVAIVAVFASQQPDYSERYATDTEAYQLGPKDEATMQGEVGELGDLAGSVVERRRQMQTLIERAYQAAGGQAHLESLRSLRKSGQLELGGETAETYYQYKRPNRMRFTLENPKGTMRMGYNGQEAWRQVVYQGHTLPAETLDIDETHMMAGNTQLVIPANAFFENWDDLHWQESTEVAGDPVYVIRYEGKLWPPQTFYIDQRTYQIRKRERTHTDSSGQEHTVGVILSDYRDVQGYQLAFEEDVYLDGERINRFHIKSFDVNLGIPDSFFDAPEPDPELLQRLQQNAAQ